MKHLKRGLSEHGPTWSLISGPALMPNFQILLSFFSWKRTRQKHWTEETPLSISRKFAFSYMICTAPSLTSPHIRYFLNCYIWRHKPHWQTCLSARLIMCGLLIKSIVHGISWVNFPWLIHPNSPIWSDWARIRTNDQPVTVRTACQKRLCSYWYHIPSCFYWSLVSSFNDDIPCVARLQQLTQGDRTFSNIEQMSPRELAQLPAWDKWSPG